MTTLYLFSSDSDRDRYCSQHRRCWTMLLPSSAIKLCMRMEMFRCFSLYPDLCLT